MEKSEKNDIRNLAIIILSVIVLALLINSFPKSNAANYSQTNKAAKEAQTSVLKNGVQEINMDVTYAGYSPNSFVLKKGVPVKWIINGKELTGCNSRILVKSYGLTIDLKQGINIIQFIPDQAGTIQWSCGMGMLRGSFIVTETGTATQAQLSSVPASGPSCGSGGCGCGAR